ncbi:MAG: NAD(P)-dependent oxidoreductase [Alicyclobacillus sp.]|nr:NAD(P)-dependent oxidoreductase [Alicyclobacillus sp.]
MRPRVGFIGLGTMGGPMAQNLVKQGYQVTVFNRTAAKAEPLARVGAAVASSPAEVARASDVLMTMLTADAAVLEVILGPGGVREGLQPGKVVVDASTVSPETSRRLAAALAEVGVEFLDAPVTGSEPQAMAGQLTFMVGGKRAVFEQVQPVLLAMGKQAFYMGESGAGSQTKLANNTLAAINLLAFAEALVLAAKAGVDPKVFLQVVASGGARSGMAENKGPKVLARDFRPQFMTSLMHKDLTLASRMAESLGYPHPMLDLAKNLLQAAMADGWGEEDSCAVVKCYERWAGLVVQDPV